MLGLAAGPHDRRTESGTQPDVTSASVPKYETSPVELSIVMPCLNEAKTLGQCIDRAHRVLIEHHVSGEIIVGDNGSRDGSRAIARMHGARVAHITRRGYGAAVMGAIRVARGQYILMGDADGSYDFGYAPRFIDALRAGCVLVMGSRFKGGIDQGAMPLLHRYLGNPILTGLGRILYAPYLTDFNCGLRAFHRVSILQLNLSSTGMELATEMIIKAILAGLPIREIPIPLHRDGRNRPSHLRPWRDGLRHLAVLLAYLPQRLTLRMPILSETGPGKPQAGGQRDSRIS